MIKELVKLANHLDSKGFVKEADYLDRIINKFANGLKGLPERTSKADGTRTRGCKDGDDSYYCMALEASRNNFDTFLGIKGTPHIRKLFKENFKIYPGSDNAKKWHDEIFGGLIDPAEFEHGGGMGSIVKKDLDDALELVLGAAGIQRTEMKTETVGGGSCAGSIFPGLCNFLPFAAPQQRTLTDYGKFLIDLIQGFPDASGNLKPGFRRNNETREDWSGDRKAMTGPGTIFGPEEVIEKK